MRRRSFTLIEVLISMGLVSMLMAALLGMYSHFAFLKRDLKVAREKGFRLSYLQSRLSRALSQVVPEAHKQFALYTSDFEGPSLVFVSDNGVDIVPNYSNLIVQRLYLNNQGMLCLASWPMPERIESGSIPMRHEVLLDGIEEIEFEFFYPSEEEEKVSTGIVVESDSVKAKPDPSEGPLYSEWKKSYRLLPVFVRLHVRGKRSNTFAFVFANHVKTLKLER